MVESIYIQRKAGHSGDGRGRVGVGGALALTFRCSMSLEPLISSCFFNRKLNGEEFGVLNI